MSDLEILRLTPQEVEQLEQALGREPEVIPELQAMLRHRAGHG